MCQKCLCLPWGWAALQGEQGGFPRCVLLFPPPIAILTSLLQNQGSTGSILPL